MRRELPIYLVLVALLPKLVSAAVIPFRPVPSKGASTKTILLYSETHSPYSLLNSVELLKLQLGRVATKVETVPLFQFEPGKLDGADYVVALFPQPYPPLLSNVVAALTNSPVPLLWIGFGAESIQQAPHLKDQFEIASRTTTSSAENIFYRGTNWNVGAFNYIQSRLPKESKAEVNFATMATNGLSAPICWKIGNLTLFGAEPQTGPLGFLFEDFLLDFFGVKEIPPSSVLLRITGYGTQSNHREFKRMADFLHFRSVPFAVSVAGLTEEAIRSEAGRNCLESLRYAQQRGGRIVLQGDDSSAPFWDTTADRPPERFKPETIRQPASASARIALEAGLLPLAWQTPQYAASSEVYTEVGKILGTAVERIQLSDATARETYAPGGLTMDRYRRLIVPENLGFVSSGSNSVTSIQDRAELLKNLRGTVLGCSIDAFQPLSKLVELMTLLESYRLPFLDLADLDNRLELPNAVLLTGKATAMVTLRDATLRWKTFNRAGQLLAEDEQRTKVSGLRELKRIGIGVVEVVQFDTNGSKQ